MERTNLTDELDLDADVFDLTLLRDDHHLTRDRLIPLVDAEFPRRLPSDISNQFLWSPLLGVQFEHDRRGRPKA